MNTNLKQTTRHCEQREAIWLENTCHPEFISGSTRHCERSEAISSRLPRPNGLAMREQTGRSMVEMLGVLAVIGVLSITGISGYTTAMNKHRANEILDAASKRAVAVSTQIQRGNTSPTLDEFGDDDDNTVQGVKFEDPATVGTDAKQFRLPLDWSDLSEDQQETLCQYMQQYISEDGTNSTALIDSDCTRILYNSDLSVGVSNTNNRDADDSTKCATGYSGTDCDSCDTAKHFTKVNNACVCDEANNYESDGNGGCKEKVTGWTAECNPACTTGICVNGTCTTATINCSSCENDATKYCAILGEGSDIQTSEITGGTCTDKPTETSVEITVNGTKKTFYKSDGINWWSSQNYCNKYHNGMAFLSDLGCDKNSCPNTVYSELGGGIYWVSDHFNQYAYRVNSDSWYIGTYWFAFDYYYALCK